MREKKVIGVTKEGETVVVGSEWSLMDSLWSLKVEKNCESDAHLLLNGPQTVKLFPGRKLEYEMKNHERPTFEQYFVTAVEFSAEYPYGRALQEAWFALPGVMLAFIVLNSLRKEGNDGEFVKGMGEFDAQVVGGYKEKLASGGCGGGCGNMVNSGGCGAGCGGGCGNMVNSGGCGAGCGGGCGSGCGGGCGNMVSSGGCGSGCGNMVNSGGCGAGCGGGCGNMVNSGGCGAGCGGGCGNMVNSGGCGSGCGGGCGNMVADVEVAVGV